MSAWKLAVRAVFERGPLRSDQVDRCVAEGMSKAVELGFLVGAGRAGRLGRGTYRLTEKGELLALGKLEMRHVPGEPGKRGPLRARPTWLAALPPAGG